ncbi:MAG TPA: DJ-1/PfpI family protein [Solirubrobacteraceae bacterium]|nr:DJ-1/PfpI family protein [Solirubrobacteraceae bacterium]
MPLPRTEIIVFDGFDDLDAVGPLEVLDAAGFPVTVVLAARGGHSRTGRVRSAHGLELTVTASLSDAPELVIVPGGGWRDGAPTGVRAECSGELPARLAELHDSGTVLASVCTGAMLLSAAGVLRGRPAVTNHIAHADLVAAGAELHAEARVVDDGSVVTCGAPAAGLDLAVHLVGRYGGDELARVVAEGFEHAPVGPVLVSAATRR